MKLAFVLVMLPALASARPLIGDPAPAGLVKLRPGHVTLVDFSATWCGPCHAALAALGTVLGRVADVDLVIVDVGEPAATVARFYADRTLPVGARVLVDEDAKAATSWGHDRFPTTFLVDGTGTIRFINRGFGPGYLARIEDKLRAVTRPPGK